MQYANEYSVSLRFFVNNNYVICLHRPIRRINRSAACAYVYYRLYVITGDEHYRDYAEFIHNNTRQANDVDGSFGYALPGMSHEGGRFADQTFTSHYHWLPWVTYVEIDPTSRLYDTFGAYDIAGAEKLDPAERVVRNRIYDTYAKF